MASADRGAGFDGRATIHFCTHLSAAPRGPDGALRIDAGLVRLRGTQVSQGFKDLSEVPSREAPFTACIVAATTPKVAVTISESLRLARMRLQNLSMDEVPGVGEATALKIYRQGEQY